MAYIGEPIPLDELEYREFTEMLSTTPPRQRVDLDQLLKTRSDSLKSKRAELYATYYGHLQKVDPNPNEVSTETVSGKPRGYK